jgi:hypothetical protein
VKRLRRAASDARALQVKSIGSNSTLPGLGAKVRVVFSHDLRVIALVRQMRAETSSRRLSRQEPIKIGTRMRKLLTIQDTFEIRGRGLLLVPEVDAAEASQRQVLVMLRAPDGTETQAKAFIQIPFSSPRPPVLRACVALLNVAKSAVPIGTDVWITD